MFAKIVMLLTYLNPWTISAICEKKQLSKQQKVRRRENLSLVYNYETAKSLPASANMPFRYTLH